MKCDKQKDADEFVPIGFRIRTVGHGDIESLVLDYVKGDTPQADRLKPDDTAILNALTAAYPNTVRRGDCKRSDGSLIPESSFERAMNRSIDLGRAERVSKGEYVLRKSPSPNDPQRSQTIPNDHQWGSHAPRITPQSPHPYRGGDVGIGAEVQEVIDVTPCMSSAVSISSYLERIEVPSFTELNAWPLPNQRYKEWLKH